MTPDFDDQYWTNRYLNDQTGWNIGYPSTPIKEFIDQLTDKTISILIPGCGNAYEAEYLLQQGFKNITLVDISEELVTRLKEKFTDKPIKIIHQDFFEHKGKYDLILEQTFFCALDPAKRKNYVAKMFELLNPQGKLAGVLFNKKFEGGPPFGGNKREYEKLFQKKFKIEKLLACRNSIPARQGTELFFELRKN